MIARSMLLLICLATSPLCVFAAEPSDDVTLRTWTDATGKRQTRAALVSVDGDIARFRRSDGTPARMTIKRLSAADRQFIATWQAAKLKPELGEFGKSLTDVFTAWPTKGLDAGKAVLKRIDDVHELNSQPPPANAVYVRVSQAFLDRRLARDIERETKVAEVILGTRNVGFAHTAGKPSLRLLPSKDDGRAELYFTGHVHARTIGYNGPVQIHSHSTTKFRSMAKLTLLPDKVTAEPSVTQASTDSTIDRITSSLPRLRGRIAVNIAWRRAQAQLAEAEAIAARRAAARITREFDKTASERIGRFSDFARNQLATGQPAVGKRVSSDQPPTVKCSTTSEYLQFVVVSPDATHWAGEPERLAERPDIEVHVHRRAMSAAMAEASLSSSQSSANPAPVARYWLSRWAVNVALPRISEILGGEDKETPRIDARWSDDDEWLTFVWRQPKRSETILARGNRHEAATARRIAVVPAR